MADDETRDALATTLVAELGWTWESEPPHVPHPLDLAGEVADAIFVDFHVVKRGPVSSAVVAAALEAHDSCTEEDPEEWMRAALEAARAAEEATS